MHDELVARDKKNRHTSYISGIITLNIHLTCRQARKFIYPGRGSNALPPACKSGALPTELPERIVTVCLRFVPIHHSELTILHKQYHL